MRERLIEGWLDRANERGYQPVFCQALSARGLSVIHSTRHGAMEFGKDVIARDENGEFHAYQLKGNPGSRLTIKQWQEILPQINTLMMQPVVPPLSPKPVAVVPYLVTNGEVDEEVQAAIGDLTALAESEGRRGLNLINRGQLLNDYIGPIANETWPPDIDLDGHILDCWGLDGEDYYSAETFHKLLLTALPFKNTPRAKATVGRAIFGAAIINELCLRRYVEADNRVALIFGRALLLAATYALIEKAGLKARSFPQIREIVWTSISDELVSLAIELDEKKKINYYDREVRLEFPYHQHSLFLLKSIFSIVGICDEKFDVYLGGNQNSKEHLREFVLDFVDLEPNRGFLVGEYAVAQFLFFYWYICLNSGKAIYDALPCQVLTNLLRANADSDEAKHIPSPYYEMPEVLEARLLPEIQGKLDKDSFQLQLWTALPLFGILVRRNLKQTAGHVFPELTKFIHRKTEVTATWAFGLFRTEEARSVGESLQYPADWHEYIERTRSGNVAMPQGLTEDLLTLSLFLLICPHRLTEEVVYYLDEVIVGNWHPPKKGP